MASSALTNYSAIVPGVLYGCAFPNADAVAELLAMPVEAPARPRCIVNLTEEPHPQAAALTAAGIDALHIPVADYQAPTMAQMAGFADLVRDPDRCPVLVHCRAGIGRTGTMLAVGLAVLPQRMPELGPQMAAAGGLVPFLRTLRKGAVEVAAQEAAVKAFMASIDQ
jgi:hypothetical protein